MSERRDTPKLIARDSHTAAHRNRARNAELVRFILLPTIFLFVALLGGVRVAGGTRALVFLPPPLVALILAALLMLLFARGRLIQIEAWLNPAHAPAVNIAHALTLLALYFAAAQSFNSVLPERGLPYVVFALFFIWSLWNNLFAPFDARTLLRSISVLFATAFVVKHFLLARLFGADRSLLERLTGTLVEGVTLGAISAPMFAPATGYLSFFTLALFLLGLFLLPRAPALNDEQATNELSPDALELYERLTPAERERLGKLINVEAKQLQLDNSGSSSAIVSSRTTS